MPEEKVDFSRMEHSVLQRVAEVMGVSVEQAADVLKKRGLDSRARKVEAFSAKVILFPARSKA